MAIKAATLKLRTIDSDVMHDVAVFLPMDGFKLDQEILGKEFTVIDVLENTFQGKKTFSVVAQNDEKIINLSAGIFKRARVLATDDLSVPANKFFNNNKNILLRSKAEDIWGASKYYHTQGPGMKADEEFVIPPKFTIEFAILREDPSNAGDPLLNPFSYDGFRKVVTHYQPEGFPTMQDFEAELKKTGADRIPGLPVETVPKTFDYINEKDVANMGFNLIFKDIPNENE